MAKLVVGIGELGVDVAVGDTSKTGFPSVRLAGSGSRRWESAVASPDLQDNFGQGRVNEWLP